MPKIVKLTAFWVLGLVMVSIAGSIAVPKIENRAIGAQSQNSNFNYYLSLAQWDGGNYLEIAKNGYSSNNLYAFAPIYPLTINFASKIFSIEYLLSGLIISGLSFFLFIVTLYKYVSKIRNASVAQTVALTFIFFPTTYFCLLVYSESLFLLITMLVIYLLEKKNNIGAILISSLIPLTRFIGIFVIIANIFQAYKRKKNRLLQIALILAVLPFLLYLYFLNTVSGDLFIFSSAQASWGRFILDPTSTVFLYFNAFLSFQHLSINSFFDLSTTVIFLVVLCKNIAKLPSNIWIISMLAILIPATTGTLTGMSRYALLSFGFFIVVGEYLHNRPKLKLWTWSIALASQAVLLSLFITGHWVA